MNEQVPKVEPTIKSEHITTSLFILILLLLSFFLHKPFPQAGFVLDAHLVVAQNPFIKQPGLFQEIFTKGMYHAYKSSQYFEVNYYRPMLLVSYIPDYKIWHLGTMGYRLTNIWFHFLNCILLFVFIKVLFKDNTLSVLTSVLFCILPIHEWVVNYVVGRGDLLQAFFSLISLIALIFYFEHKRKFWLMVSLGSFTMAVLSREVAIVLPLFAGLVSSRYLLLEKDKKRIWLAMLYFLMISALYYGLRSQLFPIIDKTFLNGFSWRNIQEWAVTTAELYLRFFIPWSLLFSIPPILKIVLFYVFCLSGLGLITYLFLKTSDDRKPSEILKFSVWWLALNAFPFWVTGKMTMRLGPYLSEHFLYFSAIGFCLMLSLVLLKIKKALLRRSLWVTVCFYYISVAMFNNGYWQNEETILKRVQATDDRPISFVARQILMKYVEDERKTKQLTEIEGPDQIKSIWLKRLGNIYRLRGQYPEAIRYFNEALRRYPHNLEALNELAIAFLQQGDTDQGLVYLQNSLELDEGYSDTHRLLGVVFYRQNELGRSRYHFEKAYFYDPDNLEVLRYLTVIYFLDRERSLYGRFLQKVTEKDEQLTDSVHFLSAEFFIHRYFGHAVSLLEEFKASVERDPRILELWAYAEMNLERREKSLEKWREVLKIEPQNKIARQFLGMPGQ